MGGVGKTSLALEYAHRHLEKLSLVWQFPAENETVLAASFTDLSRQFSAGLLAETTDPVTQVHAALAALPGDWLLIFDNAPNPSALRAVMPPAGHGRVLITTQNSLWPARVTAEVQVLDRDTAADFLALRTGDADRESAQALADALGGLPLGLEQSGAYIKAASVRISEYLEEFRVRRAELASLGKPTGYDRNIATAWSMALRNMHDQPEALTLMRIIACCAPESVPLRLLLPRNRGTTAIPAGAVDVLSPLLAGQITVDGAVSLLRQYSLIRSLDDGTVLMHRLIQDAARRDLSDAELSVWRDSTAALVAAALPADPQNPQQWNSFAALLPHATALLAPNSEPLARVVSYLGEHGSYAAACALQERALQADRAEKGAEHPQTLAARDSLAYWTGHTDQTQAARGQYAALVPVAERVLGAEHPSTLTMKVRFAGMTGAAGDPAKAQAMLSDLMPALSHVLGPADPQTLDARAWLAYWTGEAGDPASASAHLAALLPLQEDRLGLHHPAVLALRFDLARWTGSVGEADSAARARDQIQALLPVRTQVLGAKHPEVWQTRAELAYWTGEAGDVARASELLAELVPTMKDALGPEHPDVLTTLMDRAAWTGEAGDAVSARDQAAENLPLLERVFGAEHPATLGARSILARWTGEAGDPVSARDQYAVLLPLRESVLGAIHPSTLYTRARLAGWTGEAGDPAAARDQLAELLPLCQQLLGADHPHTITTARALSRWTKEAQPG
jgi:hypothetical protein